MNAKCANCNKEFSPFAGSCEILTPGEPHQEEEACPHCGTRHEVYVEVNSVGEENEKA